ncbi:MAG: hypothetical protein GMKNLPBB_01673 [Myxococcota bacterium]|nr:hypothetical protein [Myxococcota bacterium]
MQGMIDFYNKGGVWMHPITICSVIALALLLERFIAIALRYNINGPAFMAQIQKLVLANHIDRAIKLCNAAPKAALPKIVKAGLTRSNKGDSEIVAAIEEATLEVLPQLTKRTNSLAAVGNIATLLGLLGTITGLIEAFEALGTATPDKRQEVLSAGISTAMNTTAFGLIVAIPCLAAHLILTNLTNKIMSEIDEYSLKLQNMLFSRNRGETNPMDRASS